MENGENNNWKVDKHVPLASIISGAVFVLLQTVAITAYLAVLGSRVTTLEDNAKVSASQGEKIAVIQEKVTTLQAAFTRLEEWLRQNVTPKSP